MDVAALLSLILSPDLAHMHADRHCCLGQPGLPPVLILMLTSGSFSLAREYPWFLYQAQMQPWLLHLPGGTAVQPDKAFTQFQHLPVGAVS